MNLREELAGSSLGWSTATDAGYFGRVVAPCLFGCVLSGCVIGRYKPVTRMAARSADVEMRLSELRIKATSEFVYQSQSTTRHAIRRGWLTVPTRSTCSGGDPFQEIIIDGSDSSVLTPGSHEIRLRLERITHDLDLDLVVDLWLDDGKCVRAPALSQVIPLQGKKRVTMIASAAFEGHEQLAGLRGNGVFRIGAGGWVGPLLVTGEVGVGASLCTEGVCGKDEEGKLKSGLALPVAATLRYYSPLAVQHGLLFLLVLGTRYVYQPVSLPAVGGDRDFTVHGAHAILGLAMGDGSSELLTHGERNQLLELGVPVGIWMYPDAQGKNVGFGTGAELRLNMPL